MNKRAIGYTEEQYSRFLELARKRNSRYEEKNKVKLREKKKLFARKERKTPNGVTNAIYNDQVSHRKRSHKALPGYTRNQFRAWCFEQKIFWDLYKCWVLSGYKREMKPSVDRIDRFSGYSFCNIQLMTCFENCYIKGSEEKRRKVVLIGDDVVEFDSLTSVAKHLNTSTGHVCDTLKGIYKTCKGFKMEYADARKSGILPKEGQM